MSLDYRTILDSDLGLLRTAARAWRAIGDRYGTLHGNYRGHVGAVATPQLWRGAAATAYRNWTRTTLEEFASARDEARAVGRLLDEAYETLQEHKRGLESLRNQARDAGMTVSPTGRCTQDPDRTLAHQEPATRRHTEAEWTARIARAVQDTRDADRNLRLALQTDPSDGGRGLPDGFNGALRGDAGAAHARRAAALYEKLAAGEELDPSQLRDLAFLQRQNGDDPEYARTLLDALGPRGAMEAAHRLSLLSSDPDTPAAYAALEKGLATSLATATAVPVFRGPGGHRLAFDSPAYRKRFHTWLHSDAGAFYRRWRQDMRHAGAGTVDLDGDVRGYQSLVTLMRHGKDYAPQLLYDIADGVRSTEEGDPDVWDQDRKTSGRFANDPLDGVLALMADDPQTAAAYLDPGPDGHNDRLDYLVTGRDWNVVDTRRFLHDAEVRGPDTLDTDAYEGLAAALEAATTTGEHDAPHARVMAETVRLFGGEPELVQKDGDFARLRPTLGRMIADYPGDVQRLMYRDDLPVAGTPAAFGAGELHAFLGAVGRDPHAYGALTASHHHYTAEHLDAVLRGLPPGTDKSDAALEAQHAVRGGAKVLGLLSEAKADALYEERLTEIRDFNDRAEEGSKWANRLLGLGTGTLLEPSGPLAETPAGWLQEDVNDLVTEHIEKDVPSEGSKAQNAAGHDFVQSTDRAVRGARIMVGHAAIEAGMDRETLQVLKQAVAGQVGSSFSEGAGAGRPHGIAEPSS